MLSLINDSDIDRAIKIGVCNVYHFCVHNMLHEKSEEILKGLYKSAIFVIQAIIYRRTGKYIRQQNELLAVTTSDERIIVDMFLKIKKGRIIDFGVMSETLFEWCKNILKSP